MAKGHAGAQGHNTATGMTVVTRSRPIAGMYYRYYCKRCDAFAANMTAMDRVTGLATVAEICPLCMTPAAALDVTRVHETERDRVAYWTDYHNAQRRVRDLNAQLLGLPVIVRGTA